MKKYKVNGKLGEGTFSKVLRATYIKTKQPVAIKCMKAKYKSYSEVEKMKEIMALRRLSRHPCIVNLMDILYDEYSGKMGLVFEIMTMNLYELIKDREDKLPEKLVKKYMFQLFRALRHVHKNGFFHRDIKPENILILDDRLKLADFGSVQNLSAPPPFTEYISTRWYRSPECLLTDGYYGEAMDLWAGGCVMFEIISLFPLFPGTNEIHQIELIHDVLGTPSAHILHHFEKLATHIDFNFVPKKGKGFKHQIPCETEECFDLLKGLLIYDPRKRFKAKHALLHAYFNEFLQSIGTKKSEDRKHQLQDSKIALPEPKRNKVTKSKIALPSIDISRTLTPLKKRKPTKGILPGLDVKGGQEENQFHLPSLQGNSIKVHKKKKERPKALNKIYN